MSNHAQLFITVMNRFALHSVPRSGSSWVGAVLNKHPEINYFFQPLFSNSFKPSLDEWSSKEDIVHFYNALQNSNDSFVQQIRFGEKNGNRNKHAVNILYKEVRYHHIIENLIKKDPSIKIIGLIRNPLATMNSWLNAPKEFRKDLLWDELEEWKYAEKKNNGKIEEFNGFLKWKETTLLFEKLSSLYPKNFYIAKYSELLSDTCYAFEKILNYLNLEMHETILKFINETKSSENHNPSTYSIYRIKKMDNDWKSQLNPIIVKEIMNEMNHPILIKYLT
jgi:hypothetical protein